MKDCGKERVRHHVVYEWGVPYLWQMAHSLSFYPRLSSSLLSVSLPSLSLLPFLPSLRLPSLLISVSFPSFAASVLSLFPPVFPLSLPYPSAISLCPPFPPSFYHAHSLCAPLCFFLSALPFFFPIHPPLLALSLNSLPALFLRTPSLPSFSAPLSAPSLRVSSPYLFALPIRTPFPSFLLLSKGA